MSPRFSQVRNCLASTFGLALVGAVIYWAALPPLDLWPLGWAAPLPWLVLILRPELCGRRPYRSLWLVGFLFWLAAIHWLRLPHPATILGWIALSAYLGVYLPLFIGLSRVAVHRLRVPLIVAAPVVWTGLELARAHVITGFSMGALGHTQYRWLSLIQISDLGGAYAVDFLLVLVAAALAGLIFPGGQRRVVWPLVPAALVLLAALGYGLLRLEQGKSTSAGPVTRVALIQGSLDSVLHPSPEDLEAGQRRYLELTRQALARYGQVDLIVWPESTFQILNRGVWLHLQPEAKVPDDWDRPASEFRPQIEELVDADHRLVAEAADRWKAALLVGVGAVDFGPRGEKVYNSALFVSRQGEVGPRYDKVHCVMFGEYTPFVDWIPWLEKLTPLTGNAAAGTEPRAWDLEHLRIAPSICYESSLAHVIHDQVTTLAAEGREPDVLVNLTNDGWFWGSSELDMHLACAVFRAVECRKPLLIAANTGFSAWIDGDGRIVARGPRRAEGTLLAEVRPDNRRSPYLRYGNWPARLCLLACLGLTGVGVWDRWQRRRGAQQLC